MKNWTGIVVVLLIFTACNKVEVGDKRLKNSEKTIRFQRVDLFGKDTKVNNFYAENEMICVWKDSANRSELISAVIDSRFDGVLPETYPLGTLIFAHQHYERLKISQLKNADLR